MTSRDIGIAMKGKKHAATWTSLISTKLSKSSKHKTKWYFQGGTDGKTMKSKKWLSQKSRVVSFGWSLRLWSGRSMWAEEAVQFSSVQFSSVQFSHSVVSDSLRPHESQHARPTCPSPSPGVDSDSHPLSPWCHPAISSSVVPFFSCPQSLPASESFPVSQLFAWGGQSTGVSASASVLPMNTQDWSPLGWTGWISLQSKGLSRVFSNTTIQKHQFFGAQLLHSPTLTSIHDYRKNHSLN